MRKRNVGRFAAGKVDSGTSKRSPPSAGDSRRSTDDPAYVSYSAAAQLIFRYVVSSIRKDRRSWLIGVTTVALVVGFISVLQSSIQNAPYIFVRIAETEVGENDMLLQPSFSGGAPAGATADIASFLLNDTRTAALLQNNADVVGTAPRWAVLGDVIKNDLPTRNASAFVLIIDTDREREIGLGRKWTRRRLGEGEVYVAKQLLTELNVRADFGERVRVRIDLVEQLTTIGGVAITDERALVRSALVAGGLNFSATIPVDISGTTVAGITAPNGTIVQVNPNTTFDALYPAFREGLIIDQEYIVLDSIDDPQGKFPKSLGNVVILEREFFEQLVAETLEGLLAAQAGALTAGGLNPAALQAIPQFFRDERMREAALQIAVMYSNRDEAYLGDSEDVKLSMIEFSDSVFESLGTSYNASVLLPVALALEASQFISLFLNQIFSGVVFLLALLGVMVIYSLMLSDVESKTYEYGMLRALGMKNDTLGSLLLFQATTFSLPGIVIGFTFASLMNLGAVAGFAALAEVDISPVLRPSAWAIGVVLGTAIPLLANIVPIRRALGNTLRDALDVYHSAASVVTVKATRLEALGLSPFQLASSIALVVVGFVTYYILPLSFILGDLSLFLGVLNAILLCMLVGLALITIVLQPPFERLLIRVLDCTRDKKLRPMVVKNLAGHRNRNRKTATMISITVAFLVFSGALLALQATSISETLESFLGSDISVAAASWTLALPQAGLSAYLNRYTAGQPGAIDGPVAAVVDHTYTSFPLASAARVANARVSNLARVPSPRSRATGISRNYLSATYDKYTVVTEYAARYDGDSAGATNPVERMFANQRSLSLPIEDGSIRVPPVLVKGDRFAGQGSFGSTGNTVRTSTGAEIPGARDVRSIRRDYEDYVDALVSEALRGYASVDTSVPLRLRAQTDPDPDGNRELVLSLAKAHAMLQKLPGQTFSSYTPFAFNAPLLMPMEQYAALLSRTYAEAGIGADGQFLAAGATTNATAATPTVGTVTNGTNTTTTANATQPGSFTAESVPKARLFVKLQDGVAEENRLRIVNGIRSVLNNDLIQVQDTTALTESTKTAAFALDLFFNIVAAIALLLCFFAAWLSFSANIRDNSREFGILRAIGLSQQQVLRVFLYESAAIVFAAFVLGTIVGLLTAIALTLQFNLFVEMPFTFQFPTLIFCVMFTGCSAVAFFSSYLPSRPLMRAQIARVVKGTQS